MVSAELASCAVPSAPTMLANSGRRSKRAPPTMMARRGLREVLRECVEHHQYEETWLGSLSAKAAMRDEQEITDGIAYHAKRATDIESKLGGKNG